MAAVAALIPLLTAWYPAIPWEALVAAAAALLGVGEIAQRHEDAKTNLALHETSPYDRAASLQAELTKQEAEQAV
ncbi:hypothetical protein ACFY2K_11840 [Kitasatospora sp. NPDC001309]|uniref:hypothetical protein n=1 Tax=Kitasatospora sp. NPDC001309 TaxID=3364013 RepID=UPI00369B0649